MTAFFRHAGVIMFKDLRAELRTKEAINGSLAFAVVVLLMFSFAFDPSEETTRAISGGLLWIVVGWVYYLHTGIHPPKYEVYPGFDSCWGYYAPI